MEPNLVKTPSFERIQKAVADYVNSGHDVSSLTKKDEVFQLVMNATFRDKNGKRLTLEEKFNAIGFPREKKRHTDKAEVIMQSVADFQKRTGKGVEEMTTADPEYKRIKETDVYVDGKRLTLKEKFAYVGEIRERKHSDDVKGDLVAQIDDYLASGGSFHVPRESLPFFSKLVTYRKSLNRKGEHPSTEQIMRDLGYRSYSDTYFRCMQLEKLKDFRDEEGFCDAYRKDDVLGDYVISLADKLQIPDSVLVCLVANEKLRKFNLDTEYFTFLKKGLENYYLTYGTFKGISNNDPTLYKRLLHANKYLATMTGENTSPLDMLKMLGLESSDTNFRSQENDQIQDKDLIERVRKIAESKGGKLAATDFSGGDYNKIKLNAARLGVPIKDYLGMKGIEYEGRNIPRLSRVVLDYYPYMPQMIARRDELLAQSGVSEENGFTKEEVFETNLALSIQTYEEFKDKIYNFDFEAANAGRRKKIEGQKHAEK